MCDVATDPREPKEHRLFHYTRKPEHLEDMLRNGLWPRYCEEDFEWLLGEKVTLAFPMLCFCDIPLDAAETHRIRYGDYALGFSKNWVGKLDINPVWYVHAESSVGKHLSNSLRMKPRFALAQLKGHPLCGVLAFVKPTVGFQGDRAAIREGTIEVFDCDEEMEWRHTPASLADQWFQSDDRGFVTEDQHHALSNKHRLKLQFEEIDCVLVPRYDDARDFVKKFPELKEKIQVW
jgi:hypothetical protein